MFEEKSNIFFKLNFVDKIVYKIYYKIIKNERKQ